MQTRAGRHRGHGHNGMKTRKCPCQPRTQPKRTQTQKKSRALENTLRKKRGDGHQLSARAWARAWAWADGIVSPAPLFEQKKIKEQDVVATNLERTGFGMSIGMRMGIGDGKPAPLLKANKKKTEGDGHQPRAHGHWHGHRGMVSPPRLLSKKKKRERTGRGGI